jgi:hypothetical protein
MNVMNSLNISLKKSKYIHNLCINCARNSSSIVYKNNNINDKYIINIKNNSSNNNNSNNNNNNSKISDLNKLNNQIEALKRSLNMTTMITEPSIVNYFANTFLDRASNKRKDVNWINEQLQSNEAVFVLFHVNNDVRPFVCIEEETKTFSLSKFDFSQVKHFLASNDSTSADDNKTVDITKSKCNCLFLGLEYLKNDQIQSETNSSISPYSRPDLYTDKTKFRPWFAIDTSGFELNSDELSSSLSKFGKFFEGNFLRLMGIQNPLEASVIAQVV